jgi:hypothetical protein
MTGPIRLGLILAPLLAGTAAAQTPPLLACPPHLDVTPQAVVSPPAGWQATVQPSRFWLRGAEIFDGDPAARTPVRSEYDQATRSTIWTIGQGTQVPIIVCRYRGTEVTLNAEVPYGTRRCIAASRREGQAQTLAMRTGPSGSAEGLAGASPFGPSQQRNPFTTAPQARGGQPGSPPPGVVMEVICR